MRAAPSGAADLRLLRARHDVVNALVRYLRAVDGHDLDGVLAQLQHAAVSFGGPPRRGVEELTDTYRSPFAAGGRTRHLLHTPDGLAARTGTDERIVREWLANQAVVAHDATTGCFRPPPEQAFALAEESSPALVQGLFDTVAAVYRSIDKERQALRTGSGLGWGDHHPELFPATERSFRPAYRAHLVQEWLPALDGMSERLTRGARVADATEIRGLYELIAFFDAWHDTADPSVPPPLPAGRWPTTDRCCSWSRSSRTASRTTARRWVGCSPVHRR